MQAMDILRASGGIEAIANQLGISPAVAEAGAGALLPAILGGFSKQSAATGGAPANGGLGGLGDILGQLGGGALATNVLGSEPTQVAKGNDILGQIFGTKDVSRTVADHASGQTGIDPSILKQMLPILAMLVAGYLSHQSSDGQSDQPAGGGGLGAILGSILGGGGGAAASSGGLGGLGSLLDFNRDGNPLDDIIGMAGKMMR